MSAGGSALLDYAHYLRTRNGIEVAARWIENQGISFELAVLALIGSERARHYGVHVGRVARPGWKHADR